jgi:hypothetical protein
MHKDDQIEYRVKEAQDRVNNLTQSILAKAFRVSRPPNGGKSILISSVARTRAKPSWEGSKLCESKWLPPIKKKGRKSASSHAVA